MVMVSLHPMMRFPWLLWDKWPLMLSPNSLQWVSIIYSAPLSFSTTLDFAVVFRHCLRRSIGKAVHVWCTAIGNSWCSELVGHINFFHTDIPTEPLKITIKNPSTGALTFTPTTDTTDPSLVFNPTQVDILWGLVCSGFFFDTIQSSPPDLDLDLL